MMSRTALLSRPAVGDGSGEPSYMTRQLRIDEAPVEKGMFLYTRIASYRLGVSPGRFSQGCGGAPAFVELFGIRTLVVLSRHFS